jgi:adenosylcobinamide-phosphate synthase
VLAAPIPLLTLVLPLLLAALLDRVFGEPRNAWHPVAWFGRAMAPLGERIVRLPPPLAVPAGALAWLLAVGGVALLGAWVQAMLLARLAAHGPWMAVPLAAIAGLMLKPALSWRMLREEVAAVEAALVHGLDTGRAQVARLCSRDVQALDETAVRETAIETLAENLNDAWVAPLFWFALFGLPGAWAFRAANTLDAMWGYRGRWEWAGKCAARMDDLLAWLPARLTAALLWRPGVPIARLTGEARRTPSPNGGWPMAAMALRLGVKLSKPGVYVLHAAGEPARAKHMAHALRAAGCAAGAALALTVIVIVIVILVAAAWSKA